VMVSLAASAMGVASVATDGAMSSAVPTGGAFASLSGSDSGSAGEGSLARAVGSTTSAQKKNSPKTVSATADRREWVTNGLPLVAAFED
jgi:hypothetical protein